jgi:hypothetical protein
MFATMTVLAVAQEIAAAHGWPLIEDASVRPGEILIDALLHTLSLHPGAKTVTLAMNAGSQLPSNDKPQKSENVIGISREEAEALQSYFRHDYLAYDARGVLIRAVIDRIDRFCSDASKAQRQGAA